MSVTTALGFRAAGATAGLKASGRPDVALVVADRSCAVAGVLTTNRVRAAPVEVTREVLETGRARAVVLNSGGANACTGRPGLADARTMASEVAVLVGCSADEVAVASTGLIGVPLPMPAVIDGIRSAHGDLDPAGGTDAAVAIMTTDTVPKQASRRLAEGAAVATVGGMAKGAGMLAPSLATMLVVLTTDVEASAGDLDRALRSAVSRTFDRLDADGCMSTNDTVLLLASGASGLAVRPGSAAWEGFVSALGEVCADLAGQIVDDAEGASKRIEVAVRGAASDVDALTAARSVARSALFKCAMHGSDPSWGRVMAALGASAAGFDPGAVSIAFNGVEVCRNGVSTARDGEARAALGVREVTVAVDLRSGGGAASVLTTDLTAAYVHENSAYST